MERTILFNHVSAGNGTAHMADLNQPAINLVIARDFITSTTQDYLSGIDLRQHFASDWLAAGATPAIGCLKNCGACRLFRDPGDTMVDIIPAIFETTDPRGPETTAMVRTALSKFPAHEGFESLVNDTAHALRTFAAVTGAGRVASYFMAKYTVPGALWHRDNMTDKRGLITLTGPGTFWRPNGTVPAQDWLQDEHDERGMPMNNFGLFGQDFMTQAQQVGAGSLTIWKGDHHARPLIHSEPTRAVAGPALRLVMHMDMA